jgi:hypothetical protein
MMLSNLAAVEESIVMKIKCLFKLATALLCVVGWPAALTQANASVTFSFTGYIQFQQSAPVTGLSIGDQFYGDLHIRPSNSRTTFSSQ